MSDKKSDQIERIMRYSQLIQKQTGRAVRPYRADGYVNLINKYGTSKDVSEHYWFAPEPEFPDELLEIYYEGNGLFATIIDTPAEEAIKHGFELEDVQDSELVNFYQEALDELDWEENAMDALRWSRLFGGSIIVMLINDGRGIDEPLDWRNIQSIDDILVYDRSIINPDYTSMYRYEPDDPFRLRGARLGMPEYYQVFSKYGYFTVHESRCLTFRNGKLPEIARNSIYQMWGIPEYVRIHRAIRDAELAHSNAPKLLDRSVQPIYKMKDLSMELSTEQGEDMLLKRLQAIDLARGMMNSIAIDADGEDYDFKSFQFTGINDVISASCNMLSAVSHIPQTILFGAPIGGLSTTDDTAMENYYNYIERIQKRQVKANLRYLLSVIFQAGVSTGEVDEIPKIKVEFNPLWSMSDIEKADLEQRQASVQQTKAATAQVYVDMGAIDPSEVRRKLADSEEFDVENMLDEYDDEDIFGEEIPEGLDYLSEEDQQKALMVFGSYGGAHPPQGGEQQQQGGAPDQGGMPPQEGAAPDAGSMPAPEGLSTFPQPKGNANGVADEEQNTDPGTEGSASPAAPAATKLPQDMSPEELEKAANASSREDSEEDIQTHSDGVNGAVGVLCVKNGCYLGARRNGGDGKGLIGGPGGHMHKNETPEEAAIRETEEEFCIKPIELVYIGKGPVETRTGIKPDIFLCTEWEGVPKVGDGEMGEPVWYTPEMIAVLDNELFPPFKCGINTYETGVLSQNKEGRESREDEQTPIQILRDFILSKKSE